MRLSLIVPSWNGGEVLRRHLPTAAAEAARFPGGAEILVVDDASDAPGDATVRVAEAAGPTVRLLGETVRRGFGGACNAGAVAAQGELLLFLNNDMRLETGALEVLAEALAARPDWFAVVPAIENSAERFVESTVWLRFHRGVLDVVQPGRSMTVPAAPGGIRPVAYPCGGAFMTRRESFLALGGFAELYAPFYWEDADLGWRAWCSQGGTYEVVSAHVVHEHAATVGAHFASAEVRRLYERNRLLFTWNHLVGADAWATHLAWLSLRWLAAAARRDPARAGLRLALARRSAVRGVRSLRRAGRGSASRHLAAVRSTGERGWPG